MTVDQYIDNVNKRHKLGNATEHTFRGDLQQLLESLVPAIRATNEPKRQSCGAPDYIITQKDIPVGFIEAKDLNDRDLDGIKKTGNKEQFDRYKASLNNLIFTDYLSFHLYREGQFVTKITIAEITDKGIRPLPENYPGFENLIKDFCTHIGQTIKSSKKLAEMMAGKARLLSEVIEKALTSDQVHHENSTLKDQMHAFKEILIHDITPKGFADVYAQTIAYGMFAARSHDPTLPTFTRHEAYELIPKSNPFLKKLFGYIAGLDVDDRIKWIVDDLVNIFLACNVDEILKNYGKATKMEDPIIHFYETFLSEYDPKLRKARGVWYTPQPVVSFIVRAVDDILKTEFGLPQGLADTSKTKIKVDVHGKKVDKEVHKVQVLDPATGTGTFLAEVIKHIHKKFEGQQGIWSNYVENHLLPRLNGFELLMASYAMAHLKLDLLLTETGYKPTGNQRLRVYLTNSLEESHPDTGTLFANWLSTEANEANHIKRDTPVMCVIGNPPYSGESANKGEWIMKLMEDYKKEPGGKEKLKERNPKWINDDYVKFLRYGQHFIEKNGSGILAFINPHGFLDNPTFRGMRWNLLKTYDKIYTIDLHGNSKKKETAPDGSADVNVFDIMQGVSINIFVKTGKKKANELGQVFHFDLYGKREMKYDFLTGNSIYSIEFKELPNVSPNYFFTNKNFDQQVSYDEGFLLNNLFPLNNVGIVTSRDSFVIDENKIILDNRMSDFFSLDPEKLTKIYGLKENKNWAIETVKLRAQAYIPRYVTRISYRPFDERFVYYEPNFIERSRTEVMQHFTKSNNVGLVIGRQGQVVGSMQWNLSFITNSITDFNLYYRGGGNTYPLYLYPETTGQQSIEGTAARIPNLNPEIVKEIAAKLGLEFVPEKEPEGNVCLANSSEIRDDYRTTFAPIDLLDYIYAVLHSPTYREKYKEFLKIDFPRVPYPKDAATFCKLVHLGSQIRQIHLLESPNVEKFITQYPVNGDNVVTKPLFVLNEPAPVVIQNDAQLNRVENTAFNEGSSEESLENRDSSRVGMTTPPVGNAIVIQNADDKSGNAVRKPSEESPDQHALTGKVYINDSQYFDRVPQVAWEFYIGGYQPAQKWLKDRKGRALEFDDILHYQKIIVALSETDRLMKEIDAIELED